MTKEREYGPRSPGLVLEQLDFQPLFSQESSHVCRSTDFLPGNAS